MSQALRLAFFVDRGEGHAQIQARDGLQVVVRPFVMRVVLQVEVPIEFSLKPTALVSPDLQLRYATIVLLRKGK